MPLTQTSKSSSILTPHSNTSIPALFADAGAQHSYFFIEFLTAQIQNDNTRQAYYRNLVRFSDWCSQRQLEITRLNPVVISDYIKQLKKPPYSLGKLSIKQNLSAIKMLFNYYLINGVIQFNPALAVSGPKVRYNRGKTGIIPLESVGAMLKALDGSTLSGARNRALIALLIGSGARVSAAVGMTVKDFYFDSGENEWKFYFEEKRDFEHIVGAHSQAVPYIHHWLDLAGLRKQKNTPLFRAFTPARALTSNPMTRDAALQMVIDTAKKAGIECKVGCHTMRGTIATELLNQGETLERVADLLGHQSIRSTQFYDYRSRNVGQELVDKVRFS